MQSSTDIFLVAYNVIAPGNSMIISSAESNLEEELLPKIDPSQFLGKGIWLCAAKSIALAEVAQDYFFEIIDEEGKKAIFELTKIIQCFPIIEGDVAAGIYRFYQTEGSYYEIKDSLALSVFFEREPNFDYETEKLVCDADGVSIYDIRTGDNLISYERHPLSFYDVYCPLCRQQVMSYMVDSDRFLCEAISLSCPHFAGHATWTPSGYETEELNELGINYKISNGNLYFKTESGWQKPIVYVPPYHRLNSFWGSSPARDKFISHFFFVEAEPEFWIK